MKEKDSSGLKKALATIFLVFISISICVALFTGHVNIYLAIGIVLAIIACVIEGLRE